MEIDRSSLIVSKAGRDKGQLFFVIDADEQYVYLADGKSRKLANPKRKNIKHISMTDSVIDISDITDKKLRTLLRAMRSE